MTQSKDVEGATVIVGGNDAAGYRRRDRSSCCRSALVYYHAGVGCFVRAHTIYEAACRPLRCYRCNRRVQPYDGAANRAAR